MPLKALILNPIKKRHDASCIQMSIAESISNYSLELGEVQLIAVSKTKPESVIMEAYHAGQRHFGKIKFRN